jgi:hypothetical protein
MKMDKRRKWIAILLDEGLRLGVLEPSDIMRHSTPAVLATDLPSSLLAKVLQAGIGSDSFNPDLVVSTLGPENIAEHIPLPILWNCVNEAARVIIDEHPLSKGMKMDDSSTAVVDPSAVSTDEIPDIEVLES